MGTLTTTKLNLRISFLFLLFGYFFTLFAGKEIEHIFLAPQTAIKREAANFELFESVLKLPTEPTLHDFFALDLYAQLELLLAKIGKEYGNSYENAARLFLAERFPLKNIAAKEAKEFSKKIREKVLTHMQEPLVLPLSSPLMSELPALINYLANYKDVLGVLRTQKITVKSFSRQIVEKTKVCFFPFAITAEELESQIVKINDLFVNGFAKLEAWTEVDVYLQKEDDNFNFRTKFKDIHFLKGEIINTYSSRMISKSINIFYDGRQIYMPKDSYAIRIVGNFMQGERSYTDRFIFKAPETNETIPYLNTHRHFDRTAKENALNIRELVTSLTMLENYRKIYAKADESAFIPAWLKQQDKQLEHKFWLKYAAKYKQYITPENIRIAYEYHLFSDVEFAKLYSHIADNISPTNMIFSGKEDIIERIMDSLVGTVISLTDKLYIYENIFLKRNIKNVALFPNDTAANAQPFYYYNKENSQVSITRKINKKCDGMLVFWDKDKFSTLAQGKDFFERLKDEVTDLLPKSKLYLDFPGNNIDPISLFFYSHLETEAKTYINYNYGMSSQSYTPIESNILEFTKENFLQLLSFLEVKLAKADELFSSSLRFGEQLITNIKNPNDKTSLTLTNFLDLNSGKQMLKSIEKNLYEKENTLVLRGSLHGFRLSEIIKAAKQNGTNKFVLLCDFIGNWGNDDQEIELLMGSFVSKIAALDFSEFKNWERVNDGLTIIPVIGNNEILFMLAMMGDGDKLKAFINKAVNNDYPIFFLRHLLLDVPQIAEILKQNVINLAKLTEQIKAYDPSAKNIIPSLVRESWMILLNEQNKHLVSQKFKKHALFKNFYIWLRFQAKLQYVEVPDIVMLRKHYAGKSLEVTQQEQFLRAENAAGDDFLHNEFNSTWINQLTSLILGLRTSMQTKEETSVEVKEKDDQALVYIDLAAGENQLVQIMTRQIFKLKPIKESTGVIFENQEPLLDVDGEPCVGDTFFQKSIFYRFKEKINTIINIDLCRQLLDNSVLNSDKAGLIEQAA